MFVPHSRSGACAEAPRRFNPYFRMHKALRAMTGQTLTLLGTVAPSSEREVAQALAQLRELLDFTDVCLEVEVAHLHSALPADTRGDSMRVAGGEARLQACDLLRDACGSLAASEPPQRAVLVVALYEALAQWANASSIDMMGAELAIGALLWERHTDVELMAIEAAMLASGREPQLSWWLFWLVQALTPAERSDILDAAAACTAPEVVRAAVAMLDDVLPRDASLQMQARFGSRDAARTAPACALAPHSHPIFTTTPQKENP
jgi:hypothetical protein